MMKCLESLVQCLLADIQRSLKSLRDSEKTMTIVQGPRSQPPLCQHVALTPCVLMMILYGQLHGALLSQ